MRKYNEILAVRVAERLMELPLVEEKLMFDGLFFMVDGKMCISIHTEEVMFRVNPEAFEDVSSKYEWTQLTSGSKSIKGYVLVAEEALQKDEDLDFWIHLALEFNPFAKASKKKIKK